MKKKVFKSNLTLEQIDSNFNNIDFFTELHSGLSEAAGIASGAKKPLMAHRRGLPAIDVVSVRKSLKMTQKSFANMLGVSPRTVESWEAGKSTPTPTAKKLIFLVESDPSIVHRLR